MPLHLGLMSHKTKSCHIYIYIKMRHSNHKQEIKKKIGGLGQHYGGGGCGYQNISIQIIEKVPEGDTKTLENQEIYWQNQLRCYIQNGGNAHCRRKEKEKK